MSDLQTLINDAFERRADITPDNADQDVRDAVASAMASLDSGELRVAQKSDGQWIVNEWLKKAVLLSFRLTDNEPMQGGFTRYFDKVPSKFERMSEQQLAASGVRVVPPAVARYGAYVAPGVVLMPSYVNLGAYVDSGTMVDTWATVGSCAQIGVHLGKKEPRTCAAVDEVRVFANPAQTGVARQGFLKHRRAVAEAAVVERPNFALNSIGQTLQAVSQQLVVVATERIARNVGKIRLRKDSVGVVRSGWEVIHAYANDGHRARDQFVRARATDTMSRHPLHLAVPTIV